jgi:uncharacterized membrane protein
MRLVWYRFAHWLRHSPLVLVLGLMLLGVALGLSATNSNWPSTANRDEILSALGFVFGGALVLLATSLTRVVFGQVAFASGLYSPRVAARLLARPLVIWTTGLFAAVLTCAGSAWLALLNDDAEQLSVLPLAVSVVLLAVSFLGFLALIFTVTRTYRVSRVVSDTARAGLREIDRLYPLAVDEVDAGRSRAAPPEGTPDQVVRAPEGTFGVLLGFFAPWLVRVARAHGATIVIVPAVGDFVETGAPLFLVFGPKRIPERQLRAGIRLGAQRTSEQDPLFTIRLLVDVAARALSPAVNDPFTAVQAFDRIAQLLAVLARRYLDEGWHTDRSGTIRLWYTTPSWDDYVLLAFSEIRGFGAGVMPVARRLRASLFDLAALVPGPRRAVLDAQVELLDAAVAAAYPDATERAQAMTPDRQGIGATSWREQTEIELSLIDGVHAQSKPAGPPPVRGEEAE